jgi:hypothetical protein
METRENVVWMLSGTLQAATKKKFAAKACLKGVRKAPWRGE